MLYYSVPMYFALDLFSLSPQAVLFRFERLLSLEWCAWKGLMKATARKCDQQKETRSCHWGKVKSAFWLSISAFLPLPPSNFTNCLHVPSPPVIHRGGDGIKLVEVRGQVGNFLKNRKNQKIRGAYPKPGGGRATGRACLEIRKPRWRCGCGCPRQASTRRRRFGSIPKWCTKPGKGFPATTRGHMWIEL